MITVLTVRYADRLSPPQYSHVDFVNPSALQTLLAFEKSLSSSVQIKVSDTVLNV